MVLCRHSLLLAHEILKTTLGRVIIHQPQLFHVMLIIRILHLSINVIKHLQEHCDMENPIIFMM